MYFGPLFFIACSSSKAWFPGPNQYEPLIWLMVWICYGRYKNPKPYPTLPHSHSLHSHSPATSFHFSPLRTFSLGFDVHEWFFRSPNLDLSFRWCSFICFAQLMIFSWIQWRCHIFSVYFHRFSSRIFDADQRGPEVEPDGKADSAPEWWPEASLGIISATFFFASFPFCLRWQNPFR
jgi:hypothetical protein